MFRARFWMRSAGATRQSVRFHRSSWSTLLGGPKRQGHPPTRPLNLDLDDVFHLESTFPRPRRITCRAP